MAKLNEIQDKQLSSMQKSIGQLQQKMQTSDKLLNVSDMTEGVIYIHGPAGQKKVSIKLNGIVQHLV